MIAFHHGMRAKGYALGTCNRCLILLRYAMNLAVRSEIPGMTTNPTKDVSLFEDPNKAARLFYRRRKHKSSMKLSARATILCCGISCQC